MKCEPLRSPLGDVICSDLYLFTASVDTFKRKKKKSPPAQASVFKINHSRWTSGSQRYKHRHTHTHTHTHTQTCAWTQMHKHTRAHSHTNNISVQT